MIVVSGIRMALTPPARATSLSPRARLSCARWIATSDDEHAVSTARLGPRRSKRNESRFAATAWELPVPRYGDVWVEAPRQGREPLQVVDAGDADEHPRRTAAQRVRRDPGAPYRLPRHLHEQPLLRIHALRRAWGRTAPRRPSGPAGPRARRRRPRAAAREARRGCRRRGTCRPCRRSRSAPRPEPA